MKALLISGTNKKSIGLFLATYLHKKGWEIWICNRSAKNTDKNMWHERKCDFSNQRNITKLTSEIPDIDLVLFLADTGTAFGDLSRLSDRGIKDFINAKLIGSIILIKALLAKYNFRSKPIQAVWFAGKPSKREKNLLLYSIVNTAILDLVNEINANYAKTITSYYLLTPLILSPMGEAYIKSVGGKGARKMAKKSVVLLNLFLQIIKNKIPAGLVGSRKVL